MKTSILLTFLLIGLCQAITQESLEEEESLHTKRGYNFQNPIPSTPHSPWISGPSDKKYQFHIGQQSWLAAREICLTNNADLVTISNQDELDWIISHYKPQSKHIKDRQVQIGLYADVVEDELTREWRWVNGDYVNNSALSWVSGEPFDHSNGRERCGLLNINTKTLDDVDCELGGNPVRFYRFICQRTLSQHIKHEELNNPLWKKLEDILVFFGISDRTTAKNDTKSHEDLKPTPLEEEEEEDEKLTRVTPTAEPTTPTVKSTESPKEVKLEPIKPEETLKKDDIVSESDKKIIKPHSQAFGTKIVEVVPTKEDSDLLPSSNFEPLQDSAKVESETLSPVRTTRADPLAHLADTLENVSFDGADDDKMKNLERIISAVHKMVDDESDKANSTEIPPEKVQYVESKQKTEIEQNVVESNDVTQAEQVQIALNIDDDFRQAQKEQKAHPGVNSGDLLIIPKTSAEELIGCGAKNLGGTKPPAVTTTTASPQDLAEKNKKIDQVLENLRKVLNNSDSTLLNSLIENNGSSEGLAKELVKAAMVSRDERAQPENLAPSAEELESLRQKIEPDVLKSIEDLGRTEDKEFQSMETPDHDLEAIGSGLEPPSEKLVLLTPLALTAHQQIVTEKKNDDNADIVSGYTNEEKEDTSLEGKAREGEKEDNKNEEDKKNEKKLFVLSSNENLEALTENDELLPKSNETPSFSIATSTVIPESEEDLPEIKSTTGTEVQIGKSAVKLPPRKSLFPDLDFSLLKNKKLVKEAAESDKKQKKQADEAYQALKRLDQNSLAARIAASEAERKKLEQKPNLMKQPVTVKKVQQQPSLIKSKSTDDITKQLERMFYDWSNGAFGVLNG